MKKTLLFIPFFIAPAACNKTVYVPVEVIYVSFGQNIRIWLGRIFTGIVASYFIFRYLKKRFFHK